MQHKSINFILTLRHLFFNWNYYNWLGNRNRFFLCHIAHIEAYILDGGGFLFKFHLKIKHMKTEQIYICLVGQKNQYK